MTYVPEHLQAMGVKNFQVCYASTYAELSDIGVRARSAKLSHGGLVVLQGGGFWRSDWMGDMAANQITATLITILENNPEVKVAVMSA
ncbi:hypothetical protein SK128_013634 [Halocaridina rubra]|uniref:Uncharacterized protein n=1 Tax=Halocaridina rubra TaxID=373956 RepID=A0AAN8WV09_HALRR